MNTKHTKILISSFIVLLLISGCTEEFLELDDPNRVTTEKFWKTEGDLEGGVIAAYKALSEHGDGSYYMRTNPQLTEGKTENFNVSTDVITRYDIGSYINTVSNKNSALVFRYLYIGIFRANQVIFYGPQVEEIDEEARNIMIGEGHFLRGLNYFHLANEFGAVPITLELAKTSEDYFQEKATKQQVWEQVISDWDAAESVLPLSWPAQWQGRATKGAAIAWKGRAYVYQEKWNEAITEYEKLVNNEGTYGYDLMEDYAHLWDGQHENCKESIFEIQYSRDRPNVWGGRSATSTVYPQEVCSNEAGGWEEILPTPALLRAMTKEKTVDDTFDPRAKATIAWDYPGCIHYQEKFDSVYADELAEGDTVVHNRKNCHWWDTDEADWRSELNEIPMRYADVLLGLAEAYTMTGQVDKAVPLVHRIRARANLVDKQATMNGWTQNEMMEEIMHQRNVEFTREFIHFFDLRRWGTLEQVVKSARSLGWENYTSRYEYYPIPEDELNANPKIEQNEAWRGF